MNMFFLHTKEQSFYHTQRVRKQEETSYLQTPKAIKCDLALQSLEVVIGFRPTDHENHWVAQASNKFSYRWSKRMSMIAVARSYGP